MLLDELIKIMGDLLDILPRYMELSDKETRTDAEEEELNGLIKTFVKYRKEIEKSMPDVTKALFEEFVDEYYKVKIKANKGDAKAIERLKEIKPQFLVPLKVWLNNSRN